MKYRRLGRTGIEVSEVFDDFAVYPLIGLSSIFAPQWRVDVLLPRKAELSFLPDTATTVFLGIRLDGDEFRVRTSAMAGKQAFDLQVQELSIYVGAVRRFTDNISAFARLGSVVAGDHKFKQPTLSPVEGQIDPTFMFEVGFGWDF